MLLARILSILALSNSQILGSGRNSAERTGAVSVWSNLMRCFATAIWPGWPSYMSWSCDSISINGFLLVQYWADIASSLLQSFFNWVMASCLLHSCSSICDSRSGRGFWCTVATGLWTSSYFICSALLKAVLSSVLHLAELSLLNAEWCRLSWFLMEAVYWEWMKQS